MKKVFLILLVVSSSLFAKIKAPTPIPSITYKDLVIEVNTYHHGYEQSGGIIDIIKNGELIKSILVYKVTFNNQLEKDIQEVFITSVLLKENLLLITNQLGYKYQLNLDSFEVIHILEKRF